MDYRSPGSSVHGIFQARVLEWVAMTSSKGIFPTQGLNPSLLCLLYLLCWQANSLPLGPLRKPTYTYIHTFFKILFPYRFSQVALMVKNPPANGGDAGDMGSIPGSRRSPGEGNGYPLQYSSWEILWTEEPGGLSPWGHKSCIQLSN